MERFIQLHVLTAHAPSNLNRDMLGRPKSAMVGNSLRLRVSSQCTKRAWRESSIFREALKGDLGKRSRDLANFITTLLVAEGAAETKAKEIGATVAAVFKAEPKKKKAANKRAPESGEDNEKADTAGAKDVLIFLSASELETLSNIARAIASGERTNIDNLSEVVAQIPSPDVAMFGRMLAHKDYWRIWNIEAACQVAHAFTVHKGSIEQDDFAAVDELKEGPGAAHLDVGEFGSGLYYQYICIDRELLTTNLKGRADLAKNALGGLMEAVATVAPSGKQNSFGSRAYASYILAEKGKRQPRALSVAYLSAITDSAELLRTAISRLETTREQLDQSYWGESEESYVFDPGSMRGKLRELLNFVRE